MLNSCEFKNKVVYLQYKIRDSNNQLKIKDMTLKEKVAARLIKNGNNPEEVKKMVDKHFEYAASTYVTVRTIAECIRTIY